MKKTSKVKLLAGIFLVIYAVFSYLNDSSRLIFLGPSILGVYFIVDSLSQDDISKIKTDRIYHPTIWAIYLSITILMIFICVFQPDFMKSPIFIIFMVLFLFFIIICFYQVYRLKKYRKEVEPYQKAIELNLEDFSSWNNKGVITANFKAYTEAMECFVKALEIDPDDAAALHNIGVLFTKINKQQEATEFFDKSLEVDPGFEKAKRRGEIILES
jgi:tetratricopeptide (TPR) repeat protein